MSEEKKKDLGLAVVIAIVLGWLSWLSVTTLSLKERQDASSHVVPVAVEASLVELRTRLNNDQIERAKLTETAIGNAKDIGYLKETVQRLQKQ